MRRKASAEADGQTVDLTAGLESREDDAAGNAISITSEDAAKEDTEKVEGEQVKAGVGRVLQQQFGQTKKERFRVVSISVRSLRGDCRIQKFKEEAGKDAWDNDSLPGDVA